MLLEDYTELNKYISALVSQELATPTEEEPDMEGYFTWGMIEEALNSMEEPSQEVQSVRPDTSDSLLPASAQVSSVDALLCIANSAESILRRGKTTDAAVAEMVADMMRDTAQKIEQDTSLPITTRDQNLMVLWLQRYAEKLNNLPSLFDGMKSPQGLWNNIQYKVRQFHAMMA